MPIPPPPNIGPAAEWSVDVSQNAGALSGDETEFILDQTLKPKHRHDVNILRFISNYLRYRHHKQAAEESGLLPGVGYNLLRKRDVALAIEKLTDRSVLKYGYDASEVIERVKEVSNVDPLDFCNPDGTYRHMKDIPAEARRAIKKLKVRNQFDTDPNGMRVVTGEILEIELWDKMKAHELLGKEKSLFKETKRIEHDVTGDMKSVLLESTRLADERMAKLSGTDPILITSREVKDSGA